MFPERRHLTWRRKPGTSPGGNVDHRHSTRPCANTTRPNFPYPLVIKHKTTPNRPPGCTEKYAKVQIGPQRYAFPPNRNGETPKTRPFPPPTFATEIAISAPQVRTPPARAAGRVMTEFRVNNAASWLTILFDKTENYHIYSKIVNKIRTNNE